LACTVVGSKGEAVGPSHHRRHLVADVNGAIELTPDNAAGASAATTDVRLHPSVPCALAAARAIQIPLLQSATERLSLRPFSDTETRVA